MVTGVQEYLCKEVKALLGTVNHLDLFGRCPDSQPGSIPFCDILPQRKVPVSSRILQGNRTLLLKDRTSCPGNSFGIYQRSGGETAGKRDDGGIGRYPEELIEK
jgi:hypothetical protein